VTRAHARYSGESVARGPASVSGARVARVTPVPQHGRALYALACEHDLEGIVAKWAHGRYETSGTATSWIKVKNPAYSQADGRHELFEQRRTGRSSPERRELVLR
jgi:ATP-dependent DNA ligase